MKDLQKKTNSFFRDKKLLLFIIITSILIIYKNNFNFGFDNVILLFIYATFAIFLKKESRLAYYFFLIPCNNNQLLYYIHAIFFIIIIIDEALSNNLKSIINFKKTTIICYALIILEFINSLISNIYYDGNSIINSLGFSLCLLILNYLVSRRGTEMYLSKLLIGWAFGVLILVSSMLITQASYINILDGAIRLGSPTIKILLNNNVLWQDPNYLGSFCVVSAVCFFAIGSIMKNKSYYVISFLTIVFGFMTGSRSFMITVLIGVFLYLLVAKKIGKGFMRKTVIATSLGFVLLYYLSQKGIIDYILNLYVKRLSEDDFSNGRFDIILYYLRIMTENIQILLFGVGLDDYPSKIAYAFNKGKTALMAHNSLIEIFLAWGVAGFIIVIGYINKVLLRDVFTSKQLSTRNKILIILPFLLFIISTFTVTVFYSYYYMLPALTLTIITCKATYDSKVREE